ncbi:hypothetical protein HH310_07660 [Actinoplanes sp. TBRC 11911]|uniref:hypothetical protein n=1 Tax=Actinoplanes sp. TBRC 11911 TaxID=2729386 RepID=UPI00145FA28A|nr:hypothetical protein [Actinoplanes sp. TBRC 11911]NMO51064.1 hypothetical protein [Actinoplanes sp. TBRC 11911]
MSAPLLPADGSYIEMTSYGETLPEVRVVHASDAVITLSLAQASLPPANSSVELRWAAAPRGRYSMAGHVVAIDGNRVEIHFTGDVSMVQSRDFVRGGGGEPIDLVHDDGLAARGTVHDLSERSVRAHFTDVDVHAGDSLLLRIQVGDEVVELPALATKVNSMRQQIPRRGPLSVEMVAVFESSDEHQLKLIRRYIMQVQLAARSRA